MSLIKKEIEALRDIASFHTSRPIVYEPYPLYLFTIWTSKRMHGGFHEATIPSCFYDNYHIFKDYPAVFYLRLDGPEGLEFLKEKFGPSKKGVLNGKIYSEYRGHKPVYVTKLERGSIRAEHLYVLEKHGKLYSEGV